MIRFPLQFYAPFTEANDIPEYIADMVREYLKMEAGEPKDASDFISQELKLLLR